MAEYLNPISRTNWEGHGVEPDILVSEKLAVQVAYRAALMEILPTLRSSVQKSAVGREIETLTQIINRN